jgi:hypothetical protein
MACRNFLVAQASGLLFPASRRKPSAINNCPVIKSPPRAGLLTKFGATPNLTRATRVLPG